MGLIDNLIKNANPITAITSGATALAGMIGGGIANRKSSKELDRIMRQDPTMERSKYVDEGLARARMLLNAPAPSSASRRRNVYAGLGQNIANIKAGTTDASKFLAGAGAASGAAERALGAVEDYNDQFSQAREQQYSQALERSSQEDQMQYEDQLRRFSNKVQAAGTKAQNRANFWQGLTNAGGVGLNFMAQGGFGQGQQGYQPTGYGAPPNLQQLIENAIRQRQVKLGQ